MQRHIMPAAILLLGAASACSKPPTRVDPTSAALRNAPIGITVQAETVDASGRVQELAPGAALRTGDRLALHLSVAAAAYVYLGVASPDGKAELLYPPTGELQVQPGSRVRIPPQGEWITLDRQTGVENYYIYAMHAPVPRPSLMARLSADALVVKQSPLLAGASPIAEGPARGSRHSKKSVHGKGTKGAPADPQADAMLDPGSYRGPQLQPDKALSRTTAQDGMETLRLSILRR